MSKHRIGFIGTGAVAELHQLSVDKLEHAELAGITDLNQERLSRREKEWQTKAYPDARALIESDEIDIIYILSPVEAHYEQAVQALKAGKHVLIEKPVAMTVEQIREIGRVAQEMNRVCFPAHNYIYHPEMIKMKRYIEEGALGQICSAWFTFIIHHSEELASHYPGVIRQIMTHHLYTTLYLLGKPEAMSCSATKLHYQTLEREDQSVMLLEMPGGAQAVLFSSFACDDDTSSPWTYLVKVLGTQGGMNYSWRDVLYNRAIGTLGKAYPKYEELFFYESEYFINECIDKGKAPLSTLQDAAVVQHMVELAEANLGKHMISC
ncbi:gfo/Idh/MocA family oxidoreductase [Paenibacillus naphthalenovorans]|uniref:Gfo/Idh/MocA family protein n=1 Tax=Paenibacillus naphthalenovorans TaxID=162209 RepID=UPI0010B277EE|nr:Gfo/Idh/MocA family oxidoreductase [Paenibacillus naphthalenovorans]GCL71912.1 gfo/Idh/MocA family oxidoreductase [Paenibacillus naphthalenovorans]